MRRVTLLLVTFGLVFGGFGRGQDITKVATTAGQFLKLNLSPHAAGLGGAYVALANDITAPAWNPASVAFLPGRRSLGATYTNLYAGIRHLYLGYAQPTSRSSYVGLSVVYLNSGRMEVTTIDLPEGTSEYFDVADVAIGLTYARRMTDLLSLGVTVKYINERIYRESATTIAFDAGSYFNTGIAATVLGMSVTNFGGQIKYDGPDLDIDVDIDPDYEGNRPTKSRLETEAWPLPLTFRMGIRTDLIGGLNQRRPSPIHRLTWVLDANDPLDHRLRYNFGLEYSWRKILAVRAGYQPRVPLYDETNPETAVATTVYEEARYGFGLGLNLKAGSMRVKFDYAVSNFGILDFVQQAGMTVQF
jgi:hypothetical protein